jgi:hypothetical protein
VMKNNDNAENTTLYLGLYWVTNGNGSGL